MPFSANSAEQPYNAAPKARRVFALALLVAGLIGGRPSLLDAQVPPTAWEEIATSVVARPAGFRRILVPENRPAAWPVEGERYLPIEKSELDRLLATWQGRQSPAQVRVESIELTARLEAGQLVGKGTMRIESSSQQPTFMPWSNDSVQLSNATWRKNRGSELQESAEALWGVWLPDLPRRTGTTANRGLFGLVVQSGELAFDFSVVPQPDGAPQTFRLALPDAMDRRLVLELPKSIRPVAPQALVERMSDPSRTDPATQRWLIRLLSGRDIDLQLATQQDASNADAPQFTLAEQTDIFLAIGGAEIRTEWSVGLHSSVPPNTPLAEELSVEAPADLAILRVLVNGAPANWRTEPSAEGQTALHVQLSRQRLSTPPISEPSDGDEEQPDDDPFREEPPSQTRFEASALQSGEPDGQLASARFLPRKVVVEAWSVADFAQPWSLPALRPRNVYWREGSATVLVANELQLVDIPRIDGAFSTLPDGAELTDQQTTALQRYKFRCLRADPVIQLALQPAERRPTVSLQQQCELSDALVRATVSMEMKHEAAQGPHSLEAEIGAEWRVESVVATPPNYLEDWQVERARQDSTAPGTTTQLTMQLSSSAPAEEQQVHITLRRVLPSAASPLATLIPLSGIDAKVSSNRLRLAAVEPYAAVLSDAPRPVARQSLFAGEESLPSRTLEIDLQSERGAELLAKSSVVVRRRAEEFDAIAKINAKITPQGMLYQAEVIIDSPAALGRQVACQFSRPLPGQPKWYDPQTRSTLDAKRVGDLETAGTANGPTREQWTIRPGAGDAAVLRVGVETLIPWDDATRIPLIALPGAKQQSGVVRVRNADVSLLTVRHARMAPQPATGADQLAYEYDPRRVLELRQRPWLSVKQRADTALVNLPAQLERIETTWAPGAAVSHEAVYQIDSAASEWSFALSPGITLLDVTDQKSQAVLFTPVANDLTGPGRSYRVPLPEGAICTLRIAYQQEPTEKPTVVAPLAPRSESLTTNWRWDLRLPIEWQVERRATAGRDWRRRLFGPLAQTSDVRPFNPLHGADWRGLLSQLWSPRRALANQLEEPDQQTDDQNATPAALAGWHVYQFQRGGAGRTSAVVFNTSRRRYLNLAVQLLVMAAATCWLAPRRDAYLVVFLSTLVAALVAPVSWSPLASAVWFGIVTALPCHWLVSMAARPRRLSLRASSRHSVASGAPSASSILTPTLLLALLASATMAQVAPGRAAGNKENYQSPATQVAPKQLAADSAGDNTTANLEKLLIPIDEQNQPVGDKSYVRESFLRNLLAADRRSKLAGPSAVVVKGIAYRGELLSPSPSDPVKAGRWVLSLELVTAHRGAVVYFPINRDEANWAETVSIDGVPAKLSWNPTGASFVAPEPGPCRATIAFEPRATFKPDPRTKNTTTSIRFGALVTSGTQIEIAHPADLTNLQVAAAHRLPTSNPGIYRGLLKAGSRVELSWSDSKTSDESNPTVTDQPAIDLLQWVRISEGQVVTEVKVMAPDSSDSIELLVPAGWESVSQPSAARLPIVFDDAPISTTEQSDRDERAARPLSEAVQLRQRRDNSIGVVRLPELATTTGVVGRRLAAATVAETLASSTIDQETETEQPAPFAAREFLEQWTGIANSSKAPPDEAAVLSSGGSWSWAVAPARESFAMTSQRLDLTVGSQQIQCRLVVDGMRGRESLIAFTTPNDLQVTSVSIRAGDTRLSPQWAQPTPGRLVVFAPAMSSASLQLEIEGSLKTPTQSTPLPCLRLAGARTGLIETKIASTDEVLVELLDDSKLPSTAFPSIPIPPNGANLSRFNGEIETGWHVATLRVDPDEPPVLRVKQNPRQFHVEAGAAHWREAGVTYAHWTAELRVEKGQLGSLSLTSLVDKLDQVQLLSPLGATLLADPGPVQGYGLAWQLHFDEPLRAGESTRIEIRVRSSSAVGGVLPAPLLMTPGALSSRQVIGIPRLSGGPTSTVRWSVFGLRGLNSVDPARADNTLAALLPADRPWRVYLADQTSSTGNQTPTSETSPGSVFWTATNTQAGILAVRQAEMQLHARPSSAPHETSLLNARYLIQPRGAERCSINLAAGQQLRQITINGQKALCQPASFGGTVDAPPAVWDVELRSSQLPQNLEALIVCDSPASEVSAPMLSTARQGDIQPQQMLWSVAADAGQVVSPPLGARRVESAEADFIRLQALLQAAELIESPHPAWLARWRSTVAASVGSLCAAANIPLLPPSGSPRTAPQAVGQLPASAEPSLAEGISGPKTSREQMIVVVRRAQKWLSEWDDSLSAAADETTAPDTALNPTLPSASATAGESGASRVTFFVEQPTEYVAPKIAALSHSDTAGRYLAAMGLIALLAVLHWNWREEWQRIDLAHLAREYRHPLAAVGGVAWWSLLEPSSLGLVVLAAAVVGQLRLIWRRGPLPEAF